MNAATSLEDDGIATSEAESVANSDDPMESAMARERDNILASAISQLTQRQRDALMLSVIEGESIAAVARRFGVSKRALQREVQDALHLLGKLLAHRSA